MHGTESLGCFSLVERRARQQGTIALWLAAPLAAARERARFGVTDRVGGHCLCHLARCRQLSSSSRQNRRDDSFVSGLGDRPTTFANTTESRLTLSSYSPGGFDGWSDMHDPSRFKPSPDNFHPKKKAQTARWLVLFTTPSLALLPTPFTLASCKQKKRSATALGLLVLPSPDIFDKIGSTSVSVLPSIATPCK